MENIIYNELRFRGYQVDVGVVDIREKDSDEKIVRKQSGTMSAKNEDSWIKAILLLTS